jgi:hypothetical protein
VIVFEEGDAETVKSGGGVTVNETVVLRVRPAPCPWIVIVNVPVGVDVLLTKLKVALVEPFAGGVNVCGLKPVPGNT